MANAEIQRYWINKLFCWHDKTLREILKSSNGVVLYCGKCGRKVLGIHDFEMYGD